MDANNPFNITERIKQALASVVVAIVIGFLLWLINMFST